MLDSAAYRASEILAKRAIADWRFSNINDPYIFQNQGFPVRADSFLDLAQILDTMQEGRFDFYMKEVGGFSDEDTAAFVDACLDYIDFYCSFFQRERVIVPLSTLIAHFVLYKKLLGFNPQFSRLLEIGPGCGYLTFFLRNHRPLADYTQIESTESFYLLQSHINNHAFGSRFAEHVVFGRGAGDQAIYVPKLKWHDDVHYEEQKIVDVKVQPVCNHYPWWRIGEVAGRRYDLVTSNANLNEFSREALLQYLSLIRDVLADDGAIVAQCLGGGAPTYESVFAHMKTAGFVPVALVQLDNLPGRFLAVSNAVFVGEKHPLYAKYSAVKPQFPMADRSLGFLNKMYFLNEEQPERKRVLTMSDILNAILDRIEAPAQGSRLDPRQPGSEPDVGASDIGIVGEKLLSSAHWRDVNRLRRVAAMQGLGQETFGASTATASRERVGRKSTARGEVERMHLAAEVKSLKGELRAIQSSRSWKVTAPLRSLAAWTRRFRG